MNILQLLNESPLKEIDNGKTSVTKESAKKEALRLFKRSWTEAASQIESIFKKNIERREKNRISKEKLKAVNETTVSIGGKPINVNYKYESSSKFVTSAMVVGILLHLSIKYKNYVERWWDEFDKIKALSTEEKFNIVATQLKKDVQNVDKVKAINLFEEKIGSIKKAQMLFASFFGKVGFTARAKEAIEDVKSYSQAHGLVSKAVEVFIKLVFESFDKEIIEQPKAMNRFPDFKVVAKVPRGIFTGVLPGDYIEAKTQTLTTSNLNVERFKQSMGLKGDVITAESLNGKKGYGVQKAMLNLGAAAPRANKLYYFMPQGTASNFVLYKEKPDY